MVDEGGIITERCNCYVHNSTRLVNKIVKNAAARNTSVCPLLAKKSQAIIEMAAARSRVDSAEYKVRHRRIEDEKVIEEIYKFGDKLGQGSFGIVVEGYRNTTKDRWAIKKVNKEKAGNPAIKLLEREVTILKRVRHEHIIHLEEIFETSKKMYLVMELCELGDLRSLLFSDKGPFTEYSARHVIHCLADAIVYLHRNGIVHRDLKLENILIAGCRESEESPLYDIKLTDFGLSVVKGGVGSDSMLQSSCGTPVYMAPEVIQNHDYSQQCDNWSVGVILFALLSREFPFVAEKEDKLYELIKRAEVSFQAAVWTTVSKPAKNLIVKLLNVDPAHRLTASEVTSHPWTVDSLEDTNPTNVLDLMKDYAKEMANSVEDEFGSDEQDESDDKRPESGGQSSSNSDPITTNNKAKKSTKSAPLSAPGGHHDNHSTAMVHAKPVNSSYMDSARRGSLPVNLKTSPKKALGTPRKIYENKSLASGSRSPGPRIRNARSPIQGGKPPHPGNGTYRGTTSTDVTTNNGRLKPDSRLLSANRPSTPDMSPSNHQGSPLLTPRNLASANKVKKKKVPSGTKR